MKIVRGQFLVSLLTFFAFLTFGLFFLNVNVVMAEEAETPIAEAAPVEKTITTDRFVSEGQPVQIDRLGIKITPPTGWEVVTNYQGLSLAMQEPEEKLVYGKPMFRRNITVAAIQQPSPIDDKRAGKLVDEIKETFGNSGMVTNFQILEHKFFNYQGTNDGLLVYSAFTLGEFNMMQMHLLVSGKERQFLLTYNDLAERFSKDETFNLAWQSMVSIQVTGQPPKRYESLVRYGGAGGAFLALILILGFAKSRKDRINFAAEADQIYNDNNEAWEDDGKDLPTTNTGVWRIDDAEFQVEQEVIASMHDTFAGSDQKVSNVSNFF